MSEVINFDLLWNVSLNSVHVCPITQLDLDRNSAFHVLGHLCLSEIEILRSLCFLAFLPIPDGAEET